VYTVRRQPVLSLSPAPFSESIIKPATDKPEDIYYNRENVELSDYEDHPKNPSANGPCPVNQAVLSDIYERTKSIGFNGENDKRLWADILKRIETPTPLSTFKTRLRQFIILLEKLQMENTHFLFGLSESVDLKAATRIAICDEIALIHYHIKGGIDPAIDNAEYLDTQKLEISREDRILFEVMYRACRMTTFDAHRQQGPFTRAAYFPTEDEKALIHAALNIKTDQPNEMICTYTSRTSVKPDTR
jgi:hypothetical protein